MFVIGVRDKPMKLAENIDHFPVAFALNIVYGGILKEVSPS